MITAHLTETEIQLYVAEPEVLDSQQVAHVAGCALCRTQAANYELLFNGMSNAPKPTFDFDLAALVLEQLPAPKRATPWALIVIAVLGAGIVAIAALFFWTAVAASLRVVSGVLLVAAATGALTILIFQIVEMFKAHQKQMDTILSQKTLQL
jgi:hypothetical protein